MYCQWLTYAVIYNKKFNASIAIIQTYLISLIEVSIQCCKMKNVY